MEGFPGGTVGGRENLEGSMPVAMSFRLLMSLWRGWWVGEGGALLQEGRIRRQDIGVASIIVLKSLCWMRYKFCGATILCTYILCHSIHGIDNATENLLYGKFIILTKVH